MEAEEEVPLEETPQERQARLAQEAAKKRREAEAATKSSKSPSVAAASNSRSPVGDRDMAGDAPALREASPEQASRSEAKSSPSRSPVTGYEEEEDREWQPEWSKKHGALAADPKRAPVEMDQRRPSYSSTGSHDLPENSRLRMMQDLEKEKTKKAEKRRQQVDEYGIPTDPWGTNRKIQPQPTPVAMEAATVVRVEEMYDQNGTFVGGITQAEVRSAGPGRSSGPGDSGPGERSRDGTFPYTFQPDPAEEPDSYRSPGGTPVKQTKGSPTYPHPGDGSIRVNHRGASKSVQLSPSPNDGIPVFGAGQYNLAKIAADEEADRLQRARVLHAMGQYSEALEVMRGYSSPSPTRGTPNADAYLEQHRQAALAHAQGRFEDSLSISSPGRF